MTWRDFISVLVSYFPQWQSFIVRLLNELARNLFKYDVRHIPFTSPIRRFDDLVIWRFDVMTTWRSTQAQNTKFLLFNFLFLLIIEQFCDNNNDNRRQNRLPVYDNLLFNETNAIDWSAEYRSGKNSSDQSRTRDRALIFHSISRSW